MPYALPNAHRRALTVVWGITTPTIPYEGYERIYALCGIRLGTYIFVRSIHEVPNNSPFPKDSFSVLKSDLEVVIQGLIPPEVVLGYVHTHPDGHPLPSSNDILGIADNDIGLVISNSHVYRWYNNKGVFTPRIIVQSTTSE